MFIRRAVRLAAATLPRRHRMARSAALGMVTVLVAAWFTPVALAAGDEPTVTINQAASQPDPTSTSPIVFDVNFSEPVEAFVPSGISFEGSTTDGLLFSVISGSGADYTVTVTGMSSGGTVVASVKAGAANDIDGDGNVNLPSTSTDNTVNWVPGPAPTVTINQAASQPDPTSTSPIVFDVHFSEPVQGFAWDRVSFAGSTAGGVLSPTVSGSGADYTVTVTGMSSGGTVVASVKERAGFDADGFPNPPSTSTDNTVTWVPGPAPTVTINQAASQPDPTSTSPIVFDVHFSEPVQGFEWDRVSFAGSTTDGILFPTVSGSGADYTVTVTGMSSGGTVVASVKERAGFDADGFPNPPSTSTDNTVTWVPGPAPTVTINQAASQPDPASGSEVVFDVVFSEPVTGFDDFRTDLTGSTAGPVLFTQVLGSGAVYQVKVYGMTTDAGLIVATIPARAAFDADGFPNLPSSSVDNVVTWDPTPTHEFGGFFQPVDMDKLNTAKAGSAIPVKFSLGGDRGLTILRTGYPQMTRIGCTTSTATDAIESTLTAGSSGLTYDAATDQYTYAWKTSKSWAGGCYRFELGLQDGSSHTFDISFLK